MVHLSLKDPISVACKGIVCSSAVQDKKRMLKDCVRVETTTRVRLHSVPAALDDFNLLLLFFNKYFMY